MKDWNIKLYEKETFLLKKAIAIKDLSYNTQLFKTFKINTWN